MTIYPAIDMKDGKCVRLKQGDFEQLTVFNDDVAEQGLKWQSLGAEYIHLVDLDGAAGFGSNTDSVKKLLKAVKIPIQLGGGIREMSHIQAMLDLGVSRVILGTSALNVELVSEAVSRYRNRIAIGIDAKNGLVAVKGWRETSDVKAVDLALKMKSVGVSTIIYTDISKDGMMSGPNLAATKDIIDATGLDVIVSGGIASEGDLQGSFDIGAHGAIIGKALYDGSINLKEVCYKWK